MTRWQILVGDCRDVLRTLPARSVHTVVTSPPYYGLRDYGTPGQLGLEKTPDEYVAALVAVFGEVRRVLRDDGTVWLNLGDSYNSSPPGNTNPMSKSGLNGAQTSASYRKRLEETQQRQQEGRSLWSGAKPKDLLGVPWMVAFALRADGWYLRSDIIWSKPNPMPESVTDRLTKAHEYVFLLSKSARYFYDADAIREDNAPSTVTRAEAGYMHGGMPRDVSRRDTTALTAQPFEANGRNRRSVWTVATQPFAGAHFATFPPKLIEPCILAGAPERACGVCGAPWIRMVERSGEATQPGNGKAGVDGWSRNDMGHGRAGMFVSESRTTGWEPSCAHNDDTAHGTVLDPFCGAATTGLVAAQHGRDFTGIELSPEYATMGRNRLETFVRLGYRAAVTERAELIAAGQTSIFDMLDATK